MDDDHPRDRCSYYYCIDSRYNLGVHKMDGGVVVVDGMTVEEDAMMAEGAATNAVGAR